MPKNDYYSLFNQEKAFKVHTRPFFLGLSVVGLFLLAYVFSSLAETPHNAKKDDIVFLKHRDTLEPLALSQTGAVSAKELAPLGLVQEEQRERSLLAIASKKKSSRAKAVQRTKKTSRDESRSPVRTGTEFTANASGYTGPGTTRSGTKVRPGIVAVDPDYIPLGSVLWVEGYGTCRAEDTGGSITGNHIDLAFSTEKEALKWGRRDVQVKVISTP
jgi:3D (Asp-Asp-Asp) domain-containing protein